MSKELNLLEIARDYLAKGLSVVPAYKDSKHPAMYWRMFQKRRAGDEDLKSWFSDNKYNIGCICGKISGGLVIIDIDIDPSKSEILKELLNAHPLPATATVKTGSGKYHYYYRLPDNTEIRPQVEIFGAGHRWKVDIRADGAFVMMPPSTHPETGKPYKWINPLENITLINQEWLDLINQKKETEFGEAGKWETAMEGSNEGSRDRDMTSIVGKMMKELPSNMWEATIPPAMKNINAKSKPPLTEQDLRKIYNSIKHKELARRQEAGEVDEEIAEEETKEIKIKSVSLKELYNEEYSESWIIKDLIPANSITALTSPPGYFKTWLLLDMAIKIASHQKLFGEFDTALDGGVLIVNNENWAGLLHHRLKSLLSEESTEIPVYFINQENIKLTSQTTKNLLNYCAEKSVKFIIFDPFVSIHNLDENSSTAISQIRRTFEQFTKAGVSVMFTHHHRKQGLIRPTNPSEQMRGSTDIAAMIDTHLLIDKKLIEDDDGENQLTLIISQPKQRSKEPLAEFKVKIVKDEAKLSFAYDGVYNPQDERSSKINLHLPNVFEFVQQNPHCAKKEIEAAFAGKIGSRYISEILSRLEKEIQITSDGRPKRYTTVEDSASIFNHKQFPEEIVASEAVEASEELST